MLNRLTFSLLTVAFALVACSSDETTNHGSSATGHESAYPSCKAIIEACHPLDVGDGPIHDCHDLAHAATSDADCAPKKDECLRTCVPTSDAGSDGGADAD